MSAHRFGGPGMGGREFGGRRLVDLHSQWESIAFLDANIIGSGSATMIGSASADIGSQVGMESIGLGVL